MPSMAIDKLNEHFIRERDKVLSRPLHGATVTKDDSVQNLVVRTAASGFGFASEAFHYRRNKKMAESNTQIHPPLETEDASVSRELDEAAWILDEAEGRRQATTQQTGSHSTVPEEPGDLAKAFLKRHTCQPGPVSDKGLELPVVLPQRRPKSRARGFVRAYAPALADVGIDREAFLDFIDTFNKVLEPNPWLYTINLADLGGLAVPEPAMMLVGVGLGIVTDALMEAQSRFKSNRFLDRVNSGLFIPRGLVCLVVTRKPDISNDGVVTAVGFDKTAVDIIPEAEVAAMVRNCTHTESSQSLLHRIQHQVQKMTKPSNGTLGWVKPAPLIFPSPEEAAGQQEENGKKKKNVASRAGKWLDEYMDRRAQAKWIRKNPDLPMAASLPKPEFQSRYADPNHPASSGDIVALVTGGRWVDKDTNPTSSETRDVKPDPQAGRDEDVAAESREGGGRSPDSGSRSSKPHPGGLASLLQQVRYILSPLGSLINFDLNV